MSPDSPHSIEHPAETGPEETTGAPPHPGYTLLAGEEDTGPAEHHIIRGID
ncbi:hypothetical protein ACIQWL_52605 [Streptomyces mirabilis]|uniref:hypothetical protein n=1 Tax=Streptomyces mirabilis TaxID=68239 RepID=UPI000ACC69FF|nr:hypothetical protein [Streptomyces mirabilis]MCX4428533.1 hypothetical protein [Streptomyces mirabilis]MCX4428582.1 hypothetical protein [Streptomyces mirabilis]